MSGLAAPTLTPCLSLDVEVGEPIGVGQVGCGERRVVPIVGGRAEASTPRGGWRARVLPGGADFQFLPPGGSLAWLDARYVLELDSGERIYVHNRALRRGSPQDMARLARGEPLPDPGGIYFRCAPRFEAAPPSLAWLAEHLFIGTGMRHPDRVQMQFYEVG